VALFTKNGTPYFRLKGNLIAFATIVTYDIETFRSVFGNRGFFGPALGASLRWRHIALIKHFLVLFGEQERLPALNTRDLYIWHISAS